MTKAGSIRIIPEGRGLRREDLLQAPQVKVIVLFSWRVSVAGIHPDDDVLLVIPLCTINRVSGRLGRQTLRELVGTITARRIHGREERLGLEDLRHTT
uniref:Uncharacterized protein n=1 Tax=Physcomitrium patens TaxID=3218 RepID=A0A2K1J6S9_PHYPA|nr:hypothetical protein PHYPA_020329 [Physcomitrium patens]